MNIILISPCKDCGEEVGTATIEVHDNSWYRAKGEYTCDSCLPTPKAIN
jgi:hypothetical protein